MTPERFEEINELLASNRKGSRWEKALAVELLCEVKRLRAQRAEREIVYRVSDEPPDWRGRVVLGWRPPRLMGDGDWYPVIWNGSVKAWTPGDDLDGNERAFYLRDMPFPPGTATDEEEEADPEVAPAKPKMRQWCPGHAAGGEIEHVSGGKLHTDTTSWWWLGTEKNAELHACKNCGCTFVVTP